MRTFRKGGIHPPESKLTAGVPIVEIPVAPELRIMLSQSIGIQSSPIVKVGDQVSANQKIAEANGFVSASIHSPVNGTVKKIEPTRTPQGIWKDSIVIATDLENPFGENPLPRTDEEMISLSSSDIINIVGEAGIVGLGGATFPTRVKLSVPIGKKATTIIINGAECEPFLTCDDALMRLYSHEIIEGIALIIKATGATQAIVGIEHNKPEAIKAMRDAASDHDNIRVVTLRTKYPQGSEKQLIKALTGETVPAGGLPIDTGCIVDNVATIYAVYQAVRLRLPLTKRVVTISGKNLEKPGNFLVVNGTSISFLLEAAGGIPSDTGKIVAGGPMMGKAISNLEATATKGLSGLVLFSENESLRKPVKPCIRCARCVSACPMGLEPYLLMPLAQHAMWHEMNLHGALNCLECGCCSYTCPASRPLLDFIKLGKQEIRKTKI